MTIRKYNFGDRVNDDLAVIDELFNQFSFSWPYKSTQTRGTFVNTDDYDIIPKRKTIERDIQKAEQKLQELKDHRANYNRTWDEQENRLKEEIDDLRKKLSP